jgi:hypothetical protein
MARGICSQKGGFKIVRRNLTHLKGVKVAFSFTKNGQRKLCTECGVQNEVRTTDPNEYLLFGHVGHGGIPSSLGVKTMGASPAADKN